MKELRHYSPKKKIDDINIEKDIRCKCGKLWGMDYHKNICKRCKTDVIARKEKYALSNMG